MNTYLFKTQRGGQFFNAGYRTCEGVNNEFNPEDYGINIWYGFENEDNVADLAGISFKELHELFDENGYSFSEIACNSYEDENILENVLRELKIKNENSSDDDIVYIDAEDFGAVVLKDDSGDVLCTLKEFNSESGVLDIDGDYNKYDWKPANKIEFDDFELMIRDLSFDDYVDDLQYFLDENLAKFIVDNQKSFTVKSNKYPFTKFKLHANEVYDVSLKDFMHSSLIEDEDGEIIINNKHYDVY